MESRNEELQMSATDKRIQEELAKLHKNIETINQQRVDYLEEWRVKTIESVLGIKVEKNKIHNNVEKELEIIPINKEKKKAPLNKENKITKKSPLSYSNIGFMMCVLLLYIVVVKEIKFWPASLLGLYREDDFFEHTTDADEISEKLFDALEKNDEITEEQLEILIGMKEYWESNAYIDYPALHQKLYTVITREHCKMDAIMAYIPSLNWILASKEIEEKEKAYGDYNLYELSFNHEAIHMTGDLNHYYSLGEGITELINTEFFRDGEPIYNNNTTIYWDHVYCIKILCEMIEPNILLQAYSEYNENLIIEALTEICKDEKKSKKLLDEMEDFLRKDSAAKLTFEDFEQLEKTILDFAEENVENVYSVFIISSYLDSIAYKKQILETKFYFNPEAQLEDITRKSYVNKSYK